MTIRIFGVGRMKKSTTITVPDDLCADDVADVIYKAVRRLRALMSNDVECTWNESLNQGAIYAGGRLVGHSEIVT
jgi:hypothetical protein